MGHNDPEERKAYARAWYAKNKERLRAKRAPKAAEKREWARQYRQKHPERKSSANRVRRQKACSSATVWVKIVLSMPQRKALRPFADLLIERLNWGVCEATGVCLDRNQIAGPLTPHLDRIDPSRGNVYDNVQRVCGLYNQGKHNWTHEDFMFVARAAVRVWGA